MRKRIITAAVAALSAVLIFGSSTTADAATPAFREDFSKPAAFGKVDSTYPQSWQPYPNGMSEKYYSDSLIQVTDRGYFDVVFDGKRGAAGTFGTADGAWGHVGGTFTVRAKATGAQGNGVAFMLWPTSGVWADGEIDFPEGGIANGKGSPQVFHHSTVPGQERQQVQLASDVYWKDWHDYTIVWKPGVSVTYKVDGKTIGTVKKWVPTTPHRFMFQTGNTGTAGHLLVSYVETKPL